VVLGVFPPDQAGAVVGAGLDSVISTPQALVALALASAAGPPGSALARARVHVKVDTGMARVGASPHEAVGLCRAVLADPRLELSGFMTHFACADEPDPAPTLAQWARFEPLIAEVHALARAAG